MSGRLTLSGTKRRQGVTAPPGKRRRPLDALPPARIVDSLVAHVGIGEATVTSAVRYAQDLQADGFHAPAVQALASISTHNAERDFHTWLRNLHGLGLEPYFLRVILAVGEDGLAREVQMPVLAPHEVYHALHQNAAKFRQSVLGEEPTNVVLEFWERACSEPWGPKHPVMQDCSLLDVMCPLMIHYDGAEAFTDQEAHIFSCHSPFAVRGSVFDSKFLICLVMQRHIPTTAMRNDVFAEVVRFIGWSLHHGRRRLMPTHGFYGEELEPGTVRSCHAGLPIAGEWGFVFGGFKGDRATYPKLHRFQRYHLCTYLCEECDAVKGARHADPQLGYGFFGDDAAWWATLQSHDQYLARARVVSPFWHVEGWHLQLQWEDLMHNTLLGHGRDLVGSVLGEMVLEALLPRHGAADVLWLLDVEMRAWCTVWGVRKPKNRLKMSAIGWENDNWRQVYPELSSCWKAGDVRVVIAFVAALAVEQHDLGRASGEHARRRMLAAWGLSELLHVLDHAGRWLHDEERSRFARGAHCYLQCYQALVAEAQFRGQRRWKVRPKHHYFATSCGAWQPRAGIPD